MSKKEESVLLRQATFVVLLCPTNHRKIIRVIIDATVSTIKSLRESVVSGARLQTRFFT